MRRWSVRTFLTGALLLVSAAVGSATTISLNFASGPDGAAGGSNPGAPNDIAPATTAGVVVAANWNNLHDKSGTQGSLVDSTGATTTASATWASNGTYASGSGNATGNDQLMDTHIDERASGFGGPVPATVDVSGLSATGSYDVYVYYYPSFNPNAAVFSAYTIGSTTYYTEGSPTFNGTFTQETNTTLGGPFTSGANYVLFSNVSGPSFTLSADPLGFRAEINGIQIVSNPVPEPSTLVLFGVGAVGMLLAARRRRAA